MTGLVKPKTLQMVVKDEWAVDSIKSLGSGYGSFLAYQTWEIEPRVLDDIRNQRIEEGIWGEIIHLKKNTGRRVAMVEIKRMNDFSSFIRFDFIILNVSPFLRSSAKSYQCSYKCCYRENPE